MTSLSLKKRRTTRPNTSTCAERAGWLAALALLCAGAAGTQAGESVVAQPVQRSLRSLSTLPTLQRMNAAAAHEAAAPPTRASMAAPAASSGMGVVRSAVVRDSGAPRRADCDDQIAESFSLPKLPPADAPETLAAPAGPVRLIKGEDDYSLEPAPDYQPTRRFKRIAEILPHYDYTPEATGGRCQNLCPRPGEPDCPDCRSELEEPGSDLCPECPVEIRLADVDPHTSQVAAFGVRPFEPINYCWEASNIYHLPIYFEDHCLERYGHTRNYLVQPFFSAGLFATQLIGLPYQMTIDPVCKKRYILGWYRPGRYVPPRYYQIPWNTEAAIVEAAFITGGYYLFAPGVGP